MIADVLPPSPVTDPTIQLLINGVLNIFNFFVAIFAGLLCDRVGRRRLFITSTIGAWAPILSNSHIELRG